MSSGVRPGAARGPRPPAERVSLLDIFRAFFLLGVTSFGGGVIAYMRDALVERERWLDDETFLTGLELCQTLPGLNATNMSVYVGERLRGAPGALVACLGMMVPGTVFVMALGMVFLTHGHTFDMSSILLGVGSAAVGLLLATTWKLSRPVVENAADVAIIGATFLAIGYLHISLLVVLFTVGPVAVWIYRPRGSAKARSPRRTGERGR